MFDSFFNSIFGGLINQNPKLALILISFLLTLLITLVYKFTTNQKMMKETKEELKEMQKEMRGLKDDPKKMMEKQKKLMEKNMKMMMHSFKPMLFTFIPIIIMFSWLKNEYEPLGKVMFGLSWIWVYIIFSIIFSIITRKILKVY
ncbi:MAG: DUF106 domain-containing protein [Nanoarchaeota archaeon]|nr:DUF106 domain-containing protein [Nanoarchaeota archaeon]